MEEIVQTALGQRQDRRGDGLRRQMQVGADRHVDVRRADDVEGSVVTGLRRPR